MALTGGTVGYSDDGTLQLTVLDMGEDRPSRRCRVGDGGVLESPDLLVQVGRVIDVNRGSAARRPARAARRAR